MRRLAGAAFLTALGFSGIAAARGLPEPRCESWPDTFASCVEHLIDEWKGSDVDDETGLQLSLAYYQEPGAFLDVMARDTDVLLEWAQSMSKHTFRMPHPSSSASSRLACAALRELHRFIIAQPDEFRGGPKPPLPKLLPGELRELPPAGPKYVWGTSPSSDRLHAAGLLAWLLKATTDECTSSKSPDN